MTAPAGPILGIHHVTAIASDPQSNLDFYGGVLGLRLVKKTVNFDDPGTYHLYYGDELGHPGTILTFFPWPGAAQGRQGAGQVTVTGFSVPPGSLGYWVDRLDHRGIRHEPPRSRFDETVVTLWDLDGLELELVAHAAAESREAWADGPVPPDEAIRGIYAVTLTEREMDVTAELLVDTMGFRRRAEQGDRVRFDIGSGEAVAHVDIRRSPDGRAGVSAAGTVHHVAWRVAGDEEHVAWRSALVSRGLHVTPILDRHYFRSIYFREPGGVLFELATDGPGFAVDEEPGRLGGALKLPRWLEAQRTQLETVLPELHPPAVEV